MNVIDIKSQRLSSLLTAHNICQNCHVVDMDNRRSRVGYICPVCKAPSKGGMMYFNLSVHALINLMQEAYHSESKALSNDTQDDRVRAHDVAVVLFFCTLRELLLNNLIKELCHAQKIPQPIYERLLSDNKFHMQRQDQLLPALTGIKWREALQKLKNKNSPDYVKLDDFIIKAVKARNSFMHKGYKWSIPKSMGKECIQNTRPLITLYVELHNYFVHPCYHGTQDADR